MKKLLLYLIALCGLAAANAAEVTFDFVNNTYDLGERGGDKYFTTGTATSGDVSLSFAKTAGNGFRLWSDGLRVYKTGSGEATIAIKVADANVTAIEMVVKNKFTSVKYGATEFKYTSSTKAYSWEGNATDPTITISQTGGNYAITTLKVTYEVSDPSDTRLPADLEFSETSFSVLYGQAFTKPELTKATTAAVTYTSSNDDIASVDATTGDVTIEGPGTVEIKATAPANNEYQEGEASYTITVIEANKTVNSIAEAMTITDKTENLIIGFPLTVAFKNFNNTFATDGKDFIQVYGAGQPDYAVGDVIPAGWVANYTLYSDVTPEFLIVSGFGPQEATQHVEFTPAYVTEITNADVNKVVALRGVEFTEDTPSTKTNFDGVFNGQTLSFRNNYTIEGVAAGKYDVTVVVTLYKAKDATEYTPSLYVVNYSQDTTGIESVEAEDANAPVEFFNLQGVRVANPENGLFIRRQGNKVEKVVIR